MTFIFVISWLLLAWRTYSSVIVSSSNITTCDIDTGLCGTYLYVDARLTAPLADINFMSLDNAKMTIYFENITVSYKTLPSNMWDINDGQLYTDMSCSCPNLFGSSDHNPCPNNWAVQSNFAYNAWWTPIYPNAINDCEHHGSAYCCFVMWLQDVNQYTVYSDFSTQIDQLHFVYKKKPYSVSLLQTVQLVDMNLTFLGGDEYTFALTDAAVAINKVTKEAYFRRKSDINTQNELNQAKAGYWHSNAMVQGQSLESDIISHTRSVDPTDYTSPVALALLSTYQTNNAAEFSIDCPDDGTQTYNTVVNYSIIVGFSSSPGVQGIDIEYKAGTQNTTIVEINGFIVQLCIDYPTICICDTLNPLVCLDFEGLIAIRGINKIDLAKAYLNQTTLYQKTPCNSPVFSLTRVPGAVDVVIQSDNLVPVIDVSSCVPTVFMNYDISTLYIKANCSFLPCMINDDTGFSTNITASDDQKQVDLDSSYQWVDVTCLRWSQKYFKNQAQNSTNDTGIRTVVSTADATTTEGFSFSNLLSSVGKFLSNALDVILTPFEWAYDVLKDLFDWLFGGFGSWSDWLSDLLFWVVFIIYCRFGLRSVYGAIVAVVALVLFFIGGTEFAFVGTPAVMLLLLLLRILFRMKIFAKCAKCLKKCFKKKPRSKGKVAKLAKTKKIKSKNKNKKRKKSEDDDSNEDAVDELQNTVLDVMDDNNSKNLMQSLINN